MDSAAGNLVAVVKEETEEEREEERRVRRRWREETKKELEALRGVGKVRRREWRGEEEEEEGEAVEVDRLLCKRGGDAFTLGDIVRALHATCVAS